jgi:hypothetical protein
MATAPFRSACFFSTNNGQTVQRRTSAQEELAFALPANVTNIFRFDEKPVNNAGLLTQWEANASVFSMSGSQVLVDGSPAEFDPPGLLFQAMENAAALFTKMENTNDALTREEQAQLGAIAFRAAGLLV